MKDFVESSRLNTQARELTAINKLVYNLSSLSSERSFNLTTDIKLKQQQLSISDNCPEGDKKNYHTSKQPI